MFIENGNELEKLQNLSITQHFIFFTEIMANNKESLLFKDRKKYAIIGALVSDLLLKRKAGLVNNKVVITNNEKTTLEYLDKFVAYLQSLEERQYISEIIFNYKEEAKNIENEILNQLLEKDLLVDKKRFMRFLFSTEIQVKNKVLISQIKNLIRESLVKEAHPERKTIILLAIIDSMNILRQFYKTKDEYKRKKKRIEKLMEEENIAKMVYEAIKEQPEPELPPVTYMPPLYLSSGMM